MKALICLLILLFNFNIFSNETLEPLKSPKAWEVLKYKNIEANQVEFKDNQLLIKVSSSAAPIIYPFTVASKFKEILVSGEISGSISLNGKQQGSQDADDFTFRLGLVIAGDKTLNFFQRAIAPSWIKKLHSLAKDKDKTIGGIEVISFYNVIQDTNLLGEMRTHPLSELLTENFISKPDKDGKFTIKLKSELPDRKVLALWISSDGDDTNSKFDVTLTKLELRK